MKNNPLFPTTGAEYINSDTMPTVGLYGGATMWDYYHAHAPVDVPYWFSIEKVEIPRPKHFTHYPEGKFSEDDQKLLHDWHHAEDTYDLPEHLSWYQKEHDSFYVNRDKAAKDHQIAEFFQWRSYYATMMLEQRNANLPK